jgi:hypothetical protein
LEEVQGQVDSLAAPPPPPPRPAYKPRLCRSKVRLGLHGTGGPMPMHVMAFIYARPLRPGQVVIKRVLKPYKKKYLFVTLQN